MTTTQERNELAEIYAEAAQEYLRGLPPEHFMEATPQNIQRTITLESLDLIHARRAEIQFFNELLVLYPHPGQARPVGVVPDNMVVLFREPIDAVGSYDIPLQPARPFWVLEYAHKKENPDNFERYERDLQIPYYLLFEPEIQELTLYHHDAQKYRALELNEHERLSVPELEIEVAMKDGWVRFWHRGELVPLPGELEAELDRERKRANRLERQARRLEREAEELKQSLQSERDRAEKERQARLALERELAQLKRTSPPEES